MKFSLVFVLFLFILILDFEYVLSSRRRRSSSPVPSSSRRRRSPSPVPSSTRRRRSPPIRAPSSSRRRRSTPSKYPNYRKKPIYKNTKMPVIAYRSPVILSQTRYVSKSSRYPKYIVAGVAAGALTYYALNSAPVYRGYYPMYGCHLRVPNYRGIRVREERHEIVNRYTNEQCYTVKVTQADENTPSRESSYSDVPSNKDLENPANINTTIAFEDGYVLNSLGSNDIDLDDSMFNKEFNATTITDYDKEIPGTSIKGNCTRVVTTTRANMIRVYDTNPDANSALIIPVTSFILLVIIAFMSYKFL